MRPSRTSGVATRSSPAGEIDRAPTRVDVSALADGVGDFEARVGQRLGDPLPQTAGWRRLAQLDDEPGERRARPAGPEQAPGDCGRERGERDCLAEPEPALEFAASDEPALEARGERCGDEAKVGAAGQDDRRNDTLPRPARTHRSPGRDCDQQERPDQAEPDAESTEVVEETGFVRDEQEIVRAPRATERGRVVDERRQETEHEYGTGQGETDGNAFHARSQPTGRIREDRPRREGRARRVEDQPDGEHGRRADAGTIPLGKKPGAAGGDQERADGVAGMPAPEHETARDERPAGAEQGHRALG